MSNMYYGKNQIYITRRFYVGAEPYIEGIDENSNRVTIELAGLTYEPTETPKHGYELKLIKNSEETVKVEQNNAEEALKSTDKKVEQAVTANVEDVITATKISNKKSKTFIIDSDEYKQFIKDNKLDEKAIELVLEGGQKTHKGFTFKSGDMSVEW